MLVRLAKVAPVDGDDQTDRAERERRAPDESQSADLQPRNLSRGQSRAAKQDD
jgi:hypothetical protein